MRTRTLLTAGALALVSTPALAATDVMIGGFLEWIVGLIVAAMGAAITAAAGAAFRWLGVERESQLYRTVEETIANGIGWAQARVVDYVDDVDVDVRSALLADVVQYVTDQAPDELRRLGLTRARLERWAESLVMQWVSIEDGPTGGGSPVEAAEDEGGQKVARLHS